VRDNIRLMAETGWSIRATSHSDRMREALGLRPLTRPNSEEIRQILREAGLEEILHLQKDPQA
jgi:hypothetical protein